MMIAGKRNCCLGPDWTQVVEHVSTYGSRLKIYAKISNIYAKISKIYAKISKIHAKILKFYASILMLKLRQYCN